MRMSAGSTRTKLLATVAVAGVLLAAVSAVVFSAFSATTTVEDNTFQAGSINLTDSSQDSALFNVNGLKPGDVQERCVKVSYASAGNLKSRVRLYGATSGSPDHGGLDSYLNVTVTRGSFTGAQPAGNDCTGFTPDASNATVYDGLMSAFPTTFDDGTPDPNLAWADGDSAVYRIGVSLADDDRAQGLDATQEFTWEARTI